MSGSHAASTTELSPFSDRAPLVAAWAWLDEQSATFDPEIVRLAEASGRVLALPIPAHAASPARPRAAENGYAVRSADCDGASVYNSLTLPLMEGAGGELVPGTACPIASGWVLPLGADAVLPLDAAQLVDAAFSEARPMHGPRALEVLAPVPVGAGIERWRDALLAESTLLDRGRRMRPADVGLLAAIGVDRVAVIPRPRVALVVPGAKNGPDALTPMLRTLLTRDGARVEPVTVGGDSEAALAAAVVSVGIDDRALVLVAGRAGAGSDDNTAAALRKAGGAVALHGLAMRPGSASGLGKLPGTGREPVPVVLLPGEPLACLVAYDMLAARLVRRLAGQGSPLPYPVAEFELARKIVSGLGIFEVVPVRLAGGRAMPIGADAGLAIRADGFVMVPETSEGHPAATQVVVHLYDTSRIETRREV